MEKKLLWSIFWGVFAIVLVFCTPLKGMAREDVLSESHYGRLGIPLALLKNTDGAAGLLEIFGGAFSDIRVDPSVAHEFNTLYERNSVEINRFLKNNPDMVWETVEVVLNSLPAIRKLNESDGKLYIEKRTFSKAMNLFGEFEAQASPQLEEDIKQARSLLESRTSDLGPEQVLIDLGR